MYTRLPTLPFFGPRDYSVETRMNIEGLSAELSSGIKGDLGRAVASDFSPLTKVLHELGTVETRKAALSTAETWLSGMQSSLSAMQGIGETLSSKFAVALSSSDSNGVLQLAFEGSRGLDDLVRTLSSDQSGRLVFANGDTNAGSPIDLERLRSDTETIASQASDPSDLIARFDAYFAPGGGFETNALRTFPASPVSFPFGGGVAVDIPISLDDPGIRDALKQVTLISALPESGFPMDFTRRNELLPILSGRAVSARDNLVETQSRLGSVEERVDRLSTTLDEDRVKLEGRKTDLIAADPFEVATRLQNEMTRLETIFAITARRSSLRLTNFLR